MFYEHEFEEVLNKLHNNFLKYNELLEWHIKNIDINSLTKAMLSKQASETVNLFNSIKYKLYFLNELIESVKNKDKAKK